MIGVSTLLKSCAMPEASWPTACIFWLCASCTSSDLLSVLSTREDHGGRIVLGRSRVKVNSTVRWRSSPSTLASIWCRLPSPESCGRPASAAARRARRRRRSLRRVARRACAFCDRSMKAALAMRMPPSLSISAMPIGALLMKRDRRGAEISADCLARHREVARQHQRARRQRAGPAASNSTWWMSCTGMRPPVARCGRSMLKLSVTEPPGFGLDAGHQPRRRLAQEIGQRQAAALRLAARSMPQPLRPAWR